MSEQEIIKHLARNWDHRQRYEVMIPNCYITADNEADFFGIRKSGFCDEFEIKITRSDFKADAKKRVWYRQGTHEDFNWKEKGLDFPPYTKPKHEALVEGLLPPNYFWYVMPRDLCSVEEIPEHAGLIYVNDDRRSNLSVIKAPKRLHKNKLSIEDRYRHARKAQYRYWDYVLREEATV